MKIETIIVTEMIIMKIYEFLIEDIRGMKQNISVEAQSAGDAKAKLNQKTVEDIVSREEYYTDKFIKRKLVSEKNADKT